MSKLVPCFICGLGVEAMDDKAIAKLCAEHDISQNREEMRNTPVHQLLRRYNDFLQQEIGQITDNVGTTNAKYDEIRQELIILQEKIDGLDRPVTPVPVEPQVNTGQTNEFGEIV